MDGHVSIGAADERKAGRVRKARKAGLEVPKGNTGRNFSVRQTISGNKQDKCMQTVPDAPKAQKTLTLRIRTDSGHILAHEPVVYEWLGCEYDFTPAKATGVSDANGELVIPIPGTYVKIQEEDRGCLQYYCPNFLGDSHRCMVTDAITAASTVVVVKRPARVRLGFEIKDALGRQWYLGDVGLHYKEKTGPDCGHDDLGTYVKYVPDADPNIAFALDPAKEWKLHVAAGASRAQVCWNGKQSSTLSFVLGN